MEDFVPTLRKAQQADPEALGCLIAYFTPLVRTECFAFVLRGGQELSHSDLSQEVLLRLWTRLRQFRGVDDDEVCMAMFKRWLRTTTRNLVSNLIAKRKAGRRRCLEPNRSLNTGDDSQWLIDEKCETPSRIASGAEQGDRLRAAIAGLEHEQRRLIELSFFDGLSLRQAASQLQLTYEQARTRFARAIAQLKTALL
jgi:RNA polymerase sigma-70 factor (ECF subfamily)